MAEASQRTRRTRYAWIGLVLLTFLVRMPALVHDAPIDDEDVYSVVAHEILDGGLPYRDAIERKPPLLFYTYAAVFRLGGDFNWFALHLVAVLWVLATMAGLYLLVRRLFDRSAGLIAALLYSVLQPWGTYKNLALNGEVLMNLPLVWAFVLTFGREARRPRLRLAASGALVCASFLLKQPAAIAGVALAVHVWLSAARSSRLVWRERLVSLATLAMGFLIPLGLVALWLQTRDILGDALMWTVLAHDVPHVFWDRAVEHTAAFVLLALPLLLPLARWERLAAVWHGRRAEWAALLVWIGVSVIGAAAGGRFYPHYYIQLIPPLAVLAAPFYSRAPSWVSAATPWFMQPRVQQGWLVATVAIFMTLHSVGLALWSPPVAAAAFIREHSSPQDRVFVWGQAARVYAEAERRPASRYVATFPLTGYVFGPPLPEVDTTERIVPGAWSTLAAELRQRPPAFIVDAQVGPDARDPVAGFPALAQLLRSSYRPVASYPDAVVYRRVQPLPSSVLSLLTCSPLTRQRLTSAGRVRS